MNAIDDQLIRLMQGGGTGPGADQHDFAACLTHVQNHYRLIQLDSSAAGQPELDFLAAAFRLTAARGHRAVGTATIAAEPGASLRTLANATALREGAGRILSPFSGHVEQVRTSLGLEWELHRHGGEFCFASMAGGTMIAVHLHSVWVFPQRGLILYVASGVGEDSIQRDTALLFAQCLRHGEKLAGYLASGNSRTLAVTDFPCPHMSHNLWNLQTGWANLFDRCDPASIHRFVLFEDQDFFGALPDLYPELNRDSVRRVQWVENLFELILAENLYLRTVKDEIFTQSFAARVLAWARRQCSPEFLAEAARLKQACTPLVVTTIRLDNRAWIEQQQGFPALFRALRTHFPSLGLILDGLSSDTPRGWTTGWMSPGDELAMAEAIRGALPEDMEVAFSLGRSFAESLVLNDAGDLFIAPSGSGMGLYKWISNQPGLAFSNRAVLDEASPFWPLRVWHDPAFRADVCPTTHLPSRFVTDGEIARGDTSRANFHLDWRDLLEPAIAEIEKLSNPPAGQPRS